MPTEPEPFTTGAHGEAVRTFFETDRYLTRNAIIPLRANLIADLLGEVRNARVLDLGCGDGSISRPLLKTGNRLTLVDFSEAMLSTARAGTPAGAPVEFVRGDVNQYLADEPFDAAICIGVLAHLSSPEQAVARLAQGLRPGGLCVIQITDDSAPLGRLRNHYYRLRRRRGYGLRRTTRRELMSWAAAHDLTYLDERRYGLLLPGMGHLPRGWEARLESAVLTRRRLSKVGSELLARFQKSPV